MSKDILGNDIEELNVRDLINALGINRAFAKKVEKTEQQYCKLLDKHNPGFSEEIKKTLEANPGGQEDDNPQQDRDSQATLPRENSQGERNGENNHNKNHRDSNPGGQEHDNPQQGKWKKNRGSQRENSQGERNGENNHNKKHRDSNPGRQEHDGKWKKNRDSQRENSQGERNGENNHNKKHGDSNPGGQEHDNPQQGKWKKNRGSQRENSQGERNDENNHNKKHRDSNPGRQEHDGKWKKNRDSQRENSQGERNGENNHNKKHGDSNPGRQEYDNPQQGKWKKNRVPQRENSQGERNGENNHNKKHRTHHQNTDTTVNTNSITTLGENIKQKLQRNKSHIVPALIALLTLSLWPSVCNRSSSLVKDNKKVATEQKDSIKRDSESETIDKVSATGELSHFVKEGESMYSIVTNLKSSWTLSGISSVREDIIRVACEKGFIMKIKEGQTTKGKFDPRDLSPGDVIVIKIKEFEELHRQ